MRKLLVPFFCLSLFLVSLFMAPAAFGGDVFTVSGVHVDATADNALDAQIKANQEGQVEAARLLLERLSLEPPREDISTELSPEQSAKMIRGQSISNEKRSSNRYLGDITVAFNPKAVANYMQVHGLRMVAQQDRKRLVIPLYEDRQVFSPNPWLKTWQGIDTSNALTPMQTITPSPDVFRVLAAPGASLTKLATLQQIGRIYGVDKVLVLQARPQGGEIVSTLRDIALDTGTSRTVGTVHAPTAELAAQSVVKTMEEDWKAKVVAQADLKSQDLPVTALFSNAGEWVHLQNTLKNMAGVESSRLVALSNHGVSLVIGYKGDVLRLRDELAYKGITLKSDDKFGMVLEMSRR